MPLPSRGSQIRGGQPSRHLIQYPVLTVSLVGGGALVAQRRDWTVNMGSQSNLDRGGGGLGEEFWCLPFAPGSLPTLSLHSVPEADLCGLSPLLTSVRFGELGAMHVADRQRRVRSGSDSSLYCVFVGWQHAPSEAHGPCQAALSTQFCLRFKE